ncbi:MAG: hypothetical protein ACK5SX_03455 [Sandaracinobacter sp.]
MVVIVLLLLKPFMPIALHTACQPRPRERIPIFSESYVDARSMRPFTSMNGFQILGSESQLLGHCSAGEIRFFSA